MERISDKYKPESTSRLFPEEFRLEKLSAQGDLMNWEYFRTTIEKMVNADFKIIDTSFGEAPRQRNGKDKNKQIKQGKGGALWNDQSNKKRQKDIDVRYHYPHLSSCLTAIGQSVRSKRKWIKAIGSKSDNFSWPFVPT